jgi:uncharacterized protein YkwD
MNGGRLETGPARKIRLLLFAMMTLVVLAGAGLYLARGMLSPGPAFDALAPQTTVSPLAAAGTAAVAMAGTSAVVTVSPAPHGTGGSRTAPARPASGAAGASSARAGASSTASSSRPAAPATGTGTGSVPPASVPPASVPPASGAATASPSPDAAAAAWVLAVINRARAAHGLPALTVTAGLEISSAAHDLRMAGGCGLSHQCPGEPAIGARETAAGVSWTAAGENIGDGGPATDSSAVTQLALSLTHSMLEEQPPYDGHRMNILSSTFTHIGIAVYRDSAGTAWLTEDFSN